MRWPRLRTQLAVGHAAAAWGLMLVASGLLATRADDLRRQEAASGAQRDAEVIAPRLRMVTDAVRRSIIAESVAAGDRQVEVVSDSGDHLAGTSLTVDRRIADRVEAVLQGSDTRATPATGGLVLGIEPVVADDESILGAVIVAEPEPSRRGLRQAFGLSIPTALGLSAGAALVGWWVAGRVSKPLGRLAERARDLALDRAVAPSSASSIPEVATLASAMERLGRRVHRDDAERHRIDAELRRISHEIRTPLTTLRLRVEEFIDDRAGGTVNAASPDVLLGQVDRLERIARSLSAVRIGDGMLELVDLDLRTVVGRVVDELLPIARSGQLLLRIEPGPPVIVRADADLVFDAVSNVVGNALKYSPSGGQVTIRVGVDGEFPSVEVHDTGPGIDAQVRALVVRPGVRAELGTVGTGQGLAIVADAMDRHGGRLELGTSTYGGALVRLVLPVGATSTGGHSQSAKPAGQSAVHLGSVPGRALLN